MQPDLPPQQPTPSDTPPLPPNYIPPVLNARKAKAFSNKLIIVVVGAFLAIVLGVGLMVASRANDPAADINKLQAMMQSLGDIAALGTKNAKAPDVVKASTDANILITGDIANLKTVLATTGVEANKEIAAVEKKATSTVLTELKTAAIDARFDAAYVPALRSKLEATQIQLKLVHDKTSRPAVRSALLIVDGHFTALIETLNKITL